MGSVRASLRFLPGMGHRLSLGPDQQLYRMCFELHIRLQPVKTITEKENNLKLMETRYSILSYICGTNCPLQTLLQTFKFPTEIQSQQQIEKIQNEIRLIIVKSSVLLPQSGGHPRPHCGPEGRWAVTQLSVKVSKSKVTAKGIPSSSPRA